MLVFIVIILKGNNFQNAIIFLFKFINWIRVTFAAQSIIKIKMENIQNFSLTAKTWKIKIYQER